MYVQYILKKSQWIYDFNSESWEELPPLAVQPRPNLMCGVAPADDGSPLVVAAGGYYIGTVTEAVEVLDPALGGWRPGPALPRPLENAASVPYGDGQVRDTENLPRKMWCN